MKPVVYPEGVGNCHKCLWITYEWRSQLQDPECLLQFCWFVTLNLFSKDLDANIGISPWKFSSEVWQKQKKNGGDLSKLSADVLPLSKKQEGIRGLSTYGYLHFVCHNRAWEGRVYAVLSWRWRIDVRKIPDELTAAKEALFTGDKWVLISAFVTKDFFCIYRGRKFDLKPLYYFFSSTELRLSSQLWNG